MKKLILFLLITCSYATQAQITLYNNAARNTFYGIGGYSFTQQLFTSGIRPNPDVVSGPSPQNDFSYTVSAVGGIQHVFTYISTQSVNKSITLQFKSNNVKKFGCKATAVNIPTGQATTEPIFFTATTNLGNIANQTAALTDFVGFNVLSGNENEYLVSVVASFVNSSTNSIAINNIMVGDNLPQNVALNFDGVDDYVSIPSTVGNFATNDNFTVTCWFRPDPTATGERELIGKWDFSSGTNFPFTIRYNGTNGTTYAGQFTNPTFSTVGSSIDLRDGKWHHIAFTKNASALELVVDGVSAGTGTDNATGVTTNNLPLNIGRRGGGGSNYFKGEIDEVRIWTVAKNQATIQAEMFCKNPNINSLQAAYNFSNGVPHDNNPLITQVQDAVSTNHGTLNNFAKTGDASNFVTGQVKYVKRNATGSNNGSSWANAFTSLQSALVANTCNDLFDVYVFRLTYRPDALDVNISFNIPSGMSMYGGFAGTEKNLNERNRALIDNTNQTILSGDLAPDDILSDFTQNRSDNSKTVVNIYSKSNIILDGFSIRGGFGGAYGGGIDAGASQNIRINHCKIFDNSATFGGAISALNANNLLISNTYLLGNRAISNNGNAIYFSSDDGTKNMTLSNTVIAGHTGSAIYAEATVSPPNSGIVNYSYTNCTFANNGTAISNEVSSGTTINFTLKNSIIYGNTTGISTFNSGTYNQSITYSLVQGVSTGTGNLNGNTTNPQFVSPTYTNPNNAGDYRLKDPSPCINTGDDVGVSPLDLDRNPRPQGGKTDMGAFESNINLNEIISKATGNWESITTWNLERIPLPTDKVILNGHQVTITTPNARAKDLEYKTGAVLRYLSVGLLRFGL